MTNTWIKSVLKATPAYSYLSRRRERRTRVQQFRQWSAEDERRKQFYRQFIRPNDTVFDVGANIGNRTKVFLKLGARVVAFEPQKKCAEFLGAVLRNEKNAKVVELALGREEGEADMLVSNVDTISSLSADWVRATKQSGRFSQYEWNKRESVKVTTLDKAIQEFGEPTFIKIDVEGFESEVLSGLSRSIDCISIEFTPEYILCAFQCIDRMMSIAEYEFQLSIGESMKFELPAWVCGKDVKKVLACIDPSVFGDIYIRRVQSARVGLM